MRYILTLILLMALTQLAFSQNFAGLPAIFSDNMVLQQKISTPFWGKAKISGSLKINASWGQSTQIEIKKNEHWSVKLKTPKAGGPYVVKIQSGDSVITFNNVLIGEVWVCSGQSNMEMPLEGWPPNDTIMHSYSAIKNAENSKIRLFTVPRVFSDKRESDCGGTWVECNPLTAAKFSATGYFFGKKLNDALKIPVGLIHTSWGGTPVEAWISGEYLKEMSDYKPVIEKLKDSGKEIKELLAWLATHKTIDMKTRVGEAKWEGIECNDAECALQDYADSVWHTMKLPTAWERTELGDFDGIVWFRKTIEIPAAWAGKNLVLELGPIDDMDRAFVNGAKIGANEKEGLWQIGRVYDVPKEIVKEGKLTIAVRVLDNQGGGGIYGLEEKMNIHPKESQEKISIAGNWKYLPVAEYRSNQFYILGAKGEEFHNRPKLTVELSAYTPTALFNSMINPLVPYGIKGSIWYQGEANTDEPERYTSLLKMMIKNWRNEWKVGEFSFYLAQIAPYNYGEGTRSERLREAQLKTLDLKNTGMAVTLDIGNPVNIHPGNKKDIGERLAFWALAKDYGKKIAYSGPIFKEMKISGQEIALSFNYADKGLQIKPIAGKNNFTIAGKDKIFKPAIVKVSGGRLIVTSPQVKEPIAVRYAWSNVDEGTLFNGAGLPASSFRTDDWDK